MFFKELQVRFCFQYCVLWVKNTFHLTVRASVAFGGPSKWNKFCTGPEMIPGPKIIPRLTGNDPKVNLGMVWHPFIMILNFTVTTTSINMTKEIECSSTIQWTPYHSIHIYLGIISGPSWGSFWVRDHFGAGTVYSQYWEQKRTCISSKKIKHYQGSLTLHFKLNKSFKKEKVIHCKAVLETVNCPASLCSSCWSRTELTRAILRVLYISACLSFSCNYSVYLCCNNSCDHIPLSNRMLNEEEVPRNLESKWATTQIEWGQRYFILL